MSDFRWSAYRAHFCKTIFSKRPNLISSTNNTYTASLAAPHSTQHTALHSGVLNVQQLLMMIVYSSKVGNSVSNPLLGLFARCSPILILIEVLESLYMEINTFRQRFRSLELLWLEWINTVKTSSRYKGANWDPITSPAAISTNIKYS